MRILGTIFCILLFIAAVYYSLVGTAGNVETLKERAPKEMPARGWEILRYEGFQYGSYNTHGGSVWYHVREIENPNVQYRVKISLWNDELQYYYGQPEKLIRHEVEYKSK